MSTRTTALDLMDRATRLVEVALSPGAWSAARQTRPFSVAAFLLTRELAASGLAPTLVLDVGGNRGQFAASALHRWPAARVVSFEPLPGAAARLRAIDDPRLTVHEVALGATSGTVEMHEHAYSPSSSVLRSVAPASGETVRTVRLDTLDRAIQALDLEPHRTLLKLDVQGYESEVLAGAEQTVRAVEAIIVEQSFVPSYVGQPVFGDLHEQLEQLGFSLDRLVDWRRVGGRVVEVDCLYRHRSPRKPRPT